MTPYEFRCDATRETVIESFPMIDAPRIGEFVPCTCSEQGDETYHEMQRILTGSTSFAEVKGTGNGKIGRSLEDRAELGRKRRAQWA